MLFLVMIWVCKTFLMEIVANRAKKSRVLRFVPVSAYSLSKRRSDFTKNSILRVLVPQIQWSEGFEKYMGTKNHLSTSKENVDRGYRLATGGFGGCQSSGYCPKSLFWLFWDHFSKFDALVPAPGSSNTSGLGHETSAPMVTLIGKWDRRHRST